LIQFIVDDSPDKQNKCFTGNRVPILPRTAIDAEKPNVLVLFAWTIARELIKKTPEHRERGGEYVIPLPKARIVRNENDL
ncbi:MAG: SAM-dependent methyltransferase, partial [Candidatus Diapherotrites archaeon]